MRRQNGNGGIPPRFRVGNWVQWGHGTSKLRALVIEDCGPVGAHARRYYRLREYPMWTEPVEYELAEEHLEPAERPEKLPEPHDALPVP